MRLPSLSSCELYPLGPVLCEQGAEHQLGCRLGLHTCTNILVFAEVKLRRGTGFGSPLDAITARKQATIRSLAERYLSEKEPDFDSIRFDVVGILVSQGAPRLVHVPDAF
jgi:Holliday junction resolvase-like predicted endonuclease